MHSIYQVMSQDHKRCDDLFVAAQQCAARKQWEDARYNTDLFIRCMLQHFHHEETVLFPIFEQATGMSQGPTHIMRDEHHTLRELFDDLRQAIAMQNPERFMGVAESLFFYMQQHNMKEENILYPMMDQQFTPAERQRLCNIEQHTSHAA